MDATVPIEVDPDAINNRLVARLARGDYLAQLEAPYRRIPARFFSADMKRMYLRFFDSLQVNMYFVSVFARTKLPESEIVPVEEFVLKRLTDIDHEVDEAIASARALLDANGVTRPAEYESKPLDIEVRIVSKFGRRLLELMTKVDELLPLLETLAIEDLLTQGELRERKSHFNLNLRAITGAARNNAARLRNLMPKQPEETAEDETPAGDIIDAMAKKPPTSRSASARHDAATRSSTAKSTLPADTSTVTPDTSTATAVADTLVSP